MFEVLCNVRVYPWILNTDLSTNGLQPRTGSEALIGVGPVIIRLLSGKSIGELIFSVKVEAHFALTAFLFLKV